MTVLKHLTTELCEDVLVVRISTSQFIEPAYVYEFDKELAVVVQDHAQQAMMIDFSQVTRIATGVINSLLLAKKNLLSKGGDMVMFGMPSNIRHTFRLLRLDGTIFQILEDEDQAFDHFKVDT